MAEFTSTPSYRNIMDYSVYANLIGQVSGDFYSKADYVVPYIIGLQEFVITGATAGNLYEVWLDGVKVHSIIATQSTLYYNIPTRLNFIHSLWVQTGLSRTPAIRFVITRYATLLAGLANVIAVRQIRLNSLISRIKSRLSLYLFSNVIDGDTYHLMPIDTPREVAVRLFSSATNNQGSNQALLDLVSALSGCSAYQAPPFVWTPGFEVQSPYCWTFTQSQIFAGMDIYYWHPDPIRSRQLAFNQFVNNFSERFQLYEATDYETTGES